MTATLRSITEQFPFWKQAQMPEKLQATDVPRIVIGCGTSYNLALSVAAAMNANGISALAVPAGEWIVRPQAYSTATSCDVIALSRSGESTETVQAAEASRARGQHVIGITCAPGSSLSKASDTPIEFSTHPQEGIVMTCSASLMLMAGLALAGVAFTEAETDEAQAFMTAMDAVDVAVYGPRSHFVFLGGGVNYGVALEGALKLQEMAICYTQGFHPGEYRHGPVSLLDEKTCVVMLYSEETRKNERELVKELQDKGAVVLGFGGEGDISLAHGFSDGAAALGVLPALQILGERYAVHKDIDTTAPRNLTKVVMLGAK